MPSSWRRGQGGQDCRRMGRRDRSTRPAYRWGPSCGLSAPGTPGLMAVGVKMPPIAIWQVGSVTLNPPGLPFSTGRRRRQGKNAKRVRA